MRKFGAEVLVRPAFQGKDAEIEVLGRLCHLETDTDKRLAYVQRGRKNAEAAKKSCAMWDLLELPIRLERNETEELSRLVQHLQAKHINEEGVADALVQVPRANRSHSPRRHSGRDAIAAGMPSDGPGYEEVNSEGQPAAEAGKLWTPGRRFKRAAETNPRCGCRAWTERP